MLLAICLVVIGAVELVLLQLGHSYFSGGYNGVYVRRLPLVGSFLLAALAQDTWLVLGLWGIAVPLASRLRLGALQTFGVAGLVAVAVPLLMDFVRYQLHYVLGDLGGFSALWELADLPSAAAEAAAYVPPLGIPVLGVWIGLFAVLALASRLEGRVAPEPFAPPPVRHLWGGFLVVGVLVALVLQLPGVAARRIQFGLESKPSGIVLTWLGERLTDWDRDGFGLFAQLRDPNPFDASITPWAVDVPGNGIDENGIAGDHPPDFEPPYTIVPVAPPSAGPRRDVLIVFLESFRGDLIGRSFQGREVTPFLNRLAREGAHTEHAYVHTPSTVQSQAQLFTGRLTFRAGESTLVDDFKARGYFVAHFSGQNSAYGNSEGLMGVARADVFYDAREDVERRTSRSSSPVGLQISWKLLTERVSEFLRSFDREEPLYLYVNVVDTHFPYHHREIDRIFDVEPLEQAEITADRADEVWATYFNTAANVDRAVERVVTEWWELRGREGVIFVTADHGQSLYDGEGYLGHGRTLRASQTRVPFILWGVGGEWPEPIGLADVRGLLSRHLGEGETPPARFVPDPERFLLGYAPRIDSPLLLGLRSLERIVLYDFESGRFELLGADEEPLEVPLPQRRALFESLVRSWEDVRRREPHDS